MKHISNQAVENHAFAPLGVLEWRNTALDYSHPSALIRSLDAAAGRKGLTRTQENIDLTSLRHLINLPDIRQNLGGPSALRGLWHLCQIPDFRKTSDEAHFRLLRHIFRQTSAENGLLDRDWLDREILPLDKTGVAWISSAPILPISAPGPIFLTVAHGSRMQNTGRN